MGIFGKLLSGLNLAASLLIVGLMLIITADVVGRAFFRYPLYGIPEITKLGIICIVWLQMAYALRARQHLRSNLLLSAMPLAACRTIVLLNCLIGAAVMLLIAYYSYPELVRAWRMNVFEGEHPVRIPVWPIWAIVVGGAALTAVEYLLQAIQSLRGRGEEITLSRPTSVT
jgi:TRAP-type C4-dicarboxylate transport system permease small subunit